MFPEHKFLIVEALRRSGYAVGMTGDGVNDAPALKKADIGVAVQGATDAARAAADIVLTSPGLSVVIDAITISRCIFQRIQNFVLYRVACTLQLLFFFFIAVLAFQPSEYARGNRAYPTAGQTDNAVLSIFSSTQPNDNTGKPGGVLVMWKDSSCGQYTWNLTDLAKGTGAQFNAAGVMTVQHGSTNLTATQIYNQPGFGPSSGVVPLLNASYGSLGAIKGNLCVEQWPRTFAVPVIALIFITLLNDGTIISIAYDHVEPSKYPEKWNLPVSYLISGVLGAVAFGGSILYLHLMMDSHNPDSAWRTWGLGPITYGQATAAIYLKVSLSDFLTLFSARTTSWFWSLRPDIKLVFAAVAALGASTALTSQWPTKLNEKHLEAKYFDYALYGMVDQSAFNKIFEFTGTRMNGVPNFVLGTTWLYSFVWWAAQDLVKVILYIILEKFDVLHHKTQMFSNIRGDEGGMSNVTKETLVAATGRVEGKVVAMDVRDMSATVTTMEPAVREQMRPKLADLEAAMAAKDDVRITAASNEIAAAVKGYSPAQAAVLARHVESIKTSAGRAAKATASLRRKE